MRNEKGKLKTTTPELSEARKGRTTDYFPGVNLLPNRVQLLTAQKSILKREMLVERKVAFNQKAGNLGRWWTQCPQKTTSEDSARP